MLPLCSITIIKPDRSGLTQLLVGCVASDFKLGLVSGVPKFSKTVSVNRAKNISFLYLHSSDIGTPRKLLIFSSFGALGREN